MIKLNQRQIYICTSKFRACSHACCSYQEEFQVVVYRQIYLLIKDMRHL